MYIKCPRRLLNVYCRFNLRPVSRWGGGVEWGDRLTHECILAFILICILLHDIFTWKHISQVWLNASIIRKHKTLLSHLIWMGCKNYYGLTTMVLIPNFIRKPYQTGRTMSLLISTTSILIILNWERKHCAKNVQILSFFWSEYRKIWIRKKSVFGHFTQRKARETWNFLCKSSFIWLCVFSSHRKLWYLKVLNARNLPCPLTITTHTYLISYLSQLHFSHFPKRYKFTLWCSVQ